MIICRFFILFVVLTSATLSSSWGSTAITPIDSRGFIDVWALRKDVIALSNMPLGQSECSQGLGDDEEAIPKTKKARLAYERKRRLEETLAHKEMMRCERQNTKQREKFEHQSAAFNKRWLPVLNRAMRLGDPVAEVVLRLCETTPLLDRKNIAADCSEAATDKDFARQRLEKIGFLPALHNYTATNHADDFRQRSDGCGQGDAAKSIECGMRADIARYKRILAVMRTGYMAVAESWNTCQISGATPELDKLAEECQRLMNLMTAASAGTNRFYAAGPIERGGEHLDRLTLARPILQGEPGVPKYGWEYDRRGLVTRNDRRTFSDPSFQQNFYTELDKTVQEIGTNISNDLSKEPRWAIFLIERLNNKLYDSMDIINPLRPTSAQVASFEANSPRSQAIRKEQETERLKNVSYMELIASLSTLRNPKLHYNLTDFPLNLQEIGRRPAQVTKLVRAFYAETGDDIFRFNIIMILNHKRWQKFSMAEAALIEQCYVDALSDRSSMVRVEAARQPSMLGDRINDPAVKILVQRGKEEEQKILRDGFGKQ